MTTQNDLHKVWASTGTAVDPSIAEPGKYLLGWEVEIPPYEEFNYILKNLSTNILVVAESGYYTWQAGITYQPGAKVDHGGVVYTNILANEGTSPAADATRSIWVKGEAHGVDPATLNDTNGFLIKNINSRIASNTWDGSDLTLDNATPVIQLNTTNVAVKNWGLANVAGTLVALDFGTTVTPDGRSMAVSEALTHKIYHEGNKPVQADVAGTIPDAAADTKYYVRKDGAWVEMPPVTVYSYASVSEVDIGTDTTKIISCSALANSGYRHTSDSATPTIIEAGQDNLSYVSPYGLRESRLEVYSHASLSSALGTIINTSYNSVCAVGDGFYVGASGAANVVSLVKSTSSGESTVVGSSYSLSTLADCSVALMSVVGSEITVALADRGSETLRTIKFNGTSWSLLGSALSIPNLEIDSGSLCMLTDTLAVLSNQANNTVQAYTWNGTIWAATGTPITGATITEEDGACALSPTRIVVAKSTTNTFKAYDWTGSGFTAVGVETDVGYHSGQICELDGYGDTVLFVNSDRKLHAAWFNGTNWETRGVPLGIDVMGTSGLHSLTKGSSISMITPDLTLVMNSDNGELGYITLHYSQRHKTPHALLR